MKPEDKASIIEFYRKFCEMYKKIDMQKLCITSDELTNWCYDTMIKKVQKSKGKVIVAEYKNKTVGFIGFLIKESEGEQLIYNRPHKFGYVHDLFVDDKYRNLKIGTKLLADAEEYFKKNNCEFSKLMVFGTNDKAYDFYKRNNYKARNVNLIKKL